MGDNINQEFKLEALEMIDEALESLIELENGKDFEKNYKIIFRSFHSLKGAAGMFVLNELQNQMHDLEELLEHHKNSQKIDKMIIDYYLKELDFCKAYFNGAELKHHKFEDLKNENKNTTEVKETRTQSVKNVKSKGKIIIVDDEAEIGELIKEILESYDYETYYFDNGKEVLKKIKDINPDIVLSDINMPEMNGLVLTSEIHKILPQVPMVLVSAFISKESMMTALSHKVSGFIDKPFQRDYILKIVDNSVKKYQAFKLFNRSLNLIMYQFAELDEYLQKANKENIRNTLHHELKIILEQKKIFHE